jgi:hypothetical protein
MRGEVAHLARQPNEAMLFASHAASTVSFGAQLHWNVDNACGRCRFNWIPGGEEMETINALILDDLGRWEWEARQGKARQGKAGQDSTQLTELSPRGQLHATTNSGQVGDSSGKHIRVN